MSNAPRNIRKIGTAALAAIAVGTLPAPTAVAKSWLVMDEEVEKAGGWTIGYSSGFAGCLASASYNDNTRMWFGYSVKQNYFIVLVNPRWQAVQHGTTYKLDMKFRNSGNWHASFIGFNFEDAKGIAAANMKDAFMEQLASSSWLDLSASGTRMAGLSMAGTRAALEAVHRCQNARVDRARQDAATGDPRQHADGGAGRISPTPAPAPAPAPSGPSSEPKSETPSMSTGTGFFVTRKGHLMTNHHVTKKCTSIQVSYAGGALRDAVLLARDSRNDLALLKTDLEPNAVPILKPRVRVGETVYVYGFPLAGLLSKTGNFTVGYVTAAAGIADDTTQLQISAPVQPGNSGGPLVDDTGNVIGVIVSKLNVLHVAKYINDVPQNVNFAIKSSLAISFLETNGVELPDAAPGEPGPNTGTAPGRLTAADIAEHAKTYTVQIICKRDPTS